MALVRVYCGLASADESVRAASAALADHRRGGRRRTAARGPRDQRRPRRATPSWDRCSWNARVGSATPRSPPTATTTWSRRCSPPPAARWSWPMTTPPTTSPSVSPTTTPIEEMQAPPAARRAVGLARALQAGAIAAVTIPAPRELTSYKPVLAAHVAMLNGRHAAAIALREVLRELYPAALRAYPDPAHPLAMAVLDALPEPGRLTGRGNDPEQIAEDVVAELTRAGAGTEDQVDRRGHRARRGDQRVAAPRWRQQVAGPRRGRHRPAGDRGRPLLRQRLRGSGRHARRPGQPAVGRCRTPDRRVAPRAPSRPPRASSRSARARPPPGSATPAPGSAAASVPSRPPPAAHRSRRAR